MQHARPRRLRTKLGHHSSHAQDRRSVLDALTRARWLALGAANTVRMYGQRSAAFAPTNDAAAGSQDYADFPREDSVLTGTLPTIPSSPLRLSR